MSNSDLKLLGAGILVKKLLAERNISISELGVRIGASRSLMSRYVNDERPMSMEVLTAIAEALEIPREQFLLSSLQVAIPEIKGSKIGNLMRSIVEELHSEGATLTPKL